MIPLSSTRCSAPPSTIAVVGMSDKTWRASHNIGRYLAGKGYRRSTRESRANLDPRHGLLPRSRCGRSRCACAGQRRHRPRRRVSLLGERAGHRRRCDPAQAFRICGFRTESSTTKRSRAPAQPASSASRTTAFFASTPAWWWVRDDSEGFLRDQRARRRVQQLS